MSEVGSYAENVKQAWFQYLGTEPEHVKLNLEGALDLLAWTASQPTPSLMVEMDSFLDSGNEFCTTIKLYNTEEGTGHLEDLFWENPLKQAIGNDQLLEHILLAIDAIVEEYPEVLEG